MPDPDGLIQMASPFIPDIHIKNGTLGSRGHCCSFPQQIEQLFSILPRTPDNVKLIKLIRNFASKEGAVTTKAFTVRRANVLAALQWLVKYNPLYKNVAIRTSNLDWMGNKEEAEIKNVIELTSECDEDDDNDR